MDELVTEQLRHALDLMTARLDALSKEQAHARELFEARLASLEKFSQDYEARLRALQESATQFKFLVSLAAGGGLLSLIALLKTLLS